MTPDRGGSFVVPVNQPVELGGRTKMEKEADLDYDFVINHQITARDAE
jgi:hypothetical protein